MTVGQLQVDWELLLDPLSALMLLIVTWAAIQVAGTTWSERLGAINVTSSVFFFPVIVGALHSALHLLHLAGEPEATVP